MGKNRIVVPGKATLLKRRRAEVQNMVEGLVDTTQGTRSGGTLCMRFRTAREGRQSIEDWRAKDMRPLGSE